MSDMQRVQLYLSTEHPCGYLPQKTARNAYVDPAFSMRPERYAWLLENGFRRSGDHVYRPHCAHCQQCQPARVPVQNFQANRSQQRCLARNSDLGWLSVTALTDEHYDLFRLYLNARHAGEGMDADNHEAFRIFLECRWGKTQFWEFRADTQLLCVAVVDVLSQGLSAVYTFFDPAAAGRSLGTYAVLKQIEQARTLNLPHVYLGYWVHNSRKMDYKRKFRPLEIFDGSGWEILSA